MIFNFLMCLGHVPNDGKETVNFMILERVTVYFFEFVLLGRCVSQPFCYEHVLCIWKNLPPLDGDTFYFSVIDISTTEACKLDHPESITHVP